MGRETAGPLARLARTILRSLLGLFLLGLPVSVPSAAEERARPLRVESRNLVAFIDVNVVTMTSQGVLAGQTVIIRDGRIAAIGPTGSTGIPSGTRRIDGRGRFLMPGLSDMHVHLGNFSPGPAAPREVPDQIVEDELMLFLANGITLVRNLRGRPIHLAFRDRVERGELVAPRIRTAGPIIDGDPAVNEDSIHTNDPAEARRIVIEQQRTGYDYIKVYSLLRPDVYRAILETAHETGIPVIGHVSHNVGLPTALSWGQNSIEHLNGYRQFVPRIDLDRASVPTYTLWQYSDPARMAAAAAGTAAAGVWNCPTLIVMSKMFLPEQVQQELRRPEMAYVSPFVMQGWRDDPFGGLFDEPTRQQIMDSRPQRMQMARALHDAGARLLTGTDSGAILVVPGFALHQELRLLSDAGIPASGVLQASTRNAAEFIGDLDNSGTVEVGKRADLLLLDANPLDDIDNTRRIRGVMVAGRWVTREAIDAKLADIARRYRHYRPARNETHAR